MPYEGEGRSAGSGAGEFAMSKERIGRVARAARAALKEALGKVTGDRGLEAEGAAEKEVARRGVRRSGARPSGTGSRALEGPRSTRDAR